jgi:hypothetical protein
MTGPAATAAPLIAAQAATARARLARSGYIFRDPLGDAVGILWSGSCCDGLADAWRR